MNTIIIVTIIVTSLLYTCVDRLVGMEGGVVVVRI